MAGKLNRTIVCSTLFIDIVGYSKKPVDGQLEIKEHFNQAVKDSIQNVDYEERILMDTGDGAALCLLGDPEDAFFAAMTVQASITENKRTSEFPYEVRMGINLGPIKAIQDINGNLNTLGDGINVAQRIMDFAKPNQILVSQSYYDVVWNLSNAYSDIFKYQGVHKDKHVREHSVFSVVPKETKDLNESFQANLLKKTASQPVADGPEAASFPSEGLVKKSFVVDEEKLKAVVAALAQFVGPVAKALVKKAVGECSDMDQLRKKLALELDTEQEKKEFLKSLSQ